MSKTEVNSININYEIKGEGYPVVLIHGLAEDLHYWKYISNYLKDYFKVVSIDLRGHGKSDSGEDTISIELFADDIYKLLEKLDINQANIIGYSLGGQVAIESVIKHPGLYNKLVLVSTFSQIEDEMKETFKRMYDSSAVDYELFFDTIIQYILPDDMLIQYRDRLNQSKKELKNSKDINFIHNTLYSCSIFNATDELEKIQNDTLILYGKDDQIIPKKATDRLSNNIKNSRVVEFENTKHNVLIKRNFDKAKVIIKDFLEE
ncbi:MAG: alpha/beta fold hydrolase [Methanobrevibacter boviskoreani]|jgi:pimeloyl-ACP methyl ester carboxylesterase|uniref:alpha/beta fold hydrolase n=1 Tax=Methanobrevibacter boviskoreani TaxID=1348249 RepID=UPI0005952DA1|nr:alpha/beta hydrolase [Methanobrevibacter boviskoreani]